MPIHLLCVNAESTPDGVNREARKLAMTDARLTDEAKRVPARVMAEKGEAVSSTSSIGGAGIGAVSGCLSSVS